MLSPPVLFPLAAHVRLTIQSLSTSFIWSSTHTYRRSVASLELQDLVLVLYPMLVGLS